jgi:hypothetical protein
LCGDYLGIKPHFNLWNYFRVQLRPDSDMEVAMWGCADIYAHTGQRVNPYFSLSISNPPVGWQKEWFFLRDIAGVPLHVVMG